MLIQKWFALFFACLLIIASNNLSTNPYGVEAKQVLTINRKGYTKGLAYSTLGLVCKCCDGKGGECRRNWDGACSNLQCHPWKY